MKPALKILLLILAIFPLWLTILAMGEESNIEALKTRLNSEFLKMTDRRIQVISIQSHAKEISDIDSKSKMVVEITNLNIMGNSTVVIKNADSSGRLTKVVRIPVKLYVEEPVAVATRDLARSDILDRDDFKIEWRDASQLRGQAMRAQDIHHQNVRTNIKEGEVIYSSQLQKESMVAKGDRVKVRVVGSGILLTVTAQATEAGAKGQTIKVVNSDSKKEFLGVVVDDKEVEVRL